MNLDNKTLKNYRTIGHQLSPVVIISKGLSANVNNEISRALKDHELIKVKVNTNDRDAKKKLVDEICQNNKATLVQLTGHIALIYKATSKPSPKLSNLLRHKGLLK